MKHYYGMKYRSVAPGAQPKGMIDWSEGTGRYHAVIVYDRELTQKELDDYELEEVDMPSSEAHKRAVAKYYEKTYKRVGVNFKQNELESFKAVAAKLGESFDAFVNTAIRERVNRLNEEESK